MKLLDLDERLSGQAINWQQHCGHDNKCNYTKDNHWGFTTETGVILKVVNSDWKVE